MYSTKTLYIQAVKNDLLKSGMKDFLAGLALWRMFIYLGWEDIRQRYVRTFLGPLWLIIGTAMWVGVMGFVMAALFGNSVASTLPFIASGTLIWTFIANTMNDSCTLFVGSSSIIHSVSLPLSLHVLRFLVRNFIIFAHNFLIIIVVFLGCHVSLNANTLLALPGLFVLLLNALWVGTFIGILNTRYRDIQQVVATSMTVLPFITPIFWEKAFLKKHNWIATANPFYHAVEIVRAPLLGHAPAMSSWAIMGGITLMGGLLMLGLFSKYKNRVIYWL